jgi:hypothetical protein
MPHTTILVLFALILLAALTAHAATLHVATTGNDAASGSASAPFRTLQRGVKALKGGDTLVV